MAGRYEPAINSVIGFYYSVNDQTFPGFVYFVDFYHKATNSKDHTEHRLNTIIELPIEQTSSNISIRTRMLFNTNNLVAPVFDYEPLPTSKIVLEGDFGQFYYVHCGEGPEYRLTSLTLLEPNLMLKILENFGNVSIYIIQNKLFIVIPKFVEDSEKLINAIRNAGQLTEQINHTVKGINSENRHDVESKAAKLKKNKLSLNTKLAIIIGGSFILMRVAFGVFANFTEANPIFHKIFLLLTVGLLSLAIVIAIIAMTKAYGLKRRYIKKYGKNGIY